MATLTNPLPNYAMPLNQPTAVDDRRSEPRFGAEGEVTVVVREDSHERELLAKLLDFSLHGLRVRVPYEVSPGTEVSVFFSWGEVTTQVMWSTATASGFEIGLQLF